MIRRHIWLLKNTHFQADQKYVGAASALGESSSANLRDEDSSDRREKKTRLARSRPAQGCGVFAGRPSIFQWPDWTRLQGGWRVLATSLCLAGLLSLAACWGGEEPPSIWEKRTGAFTLQEAEQLYGPATACQEMGHGERMCAWFTGGRGGWSDRAVLIFDKQDILTSVERKGTLE